MYKRQVILSVTAAVLVLLFAWNGISSILANRRTGDTITVAGKDYTEQVVLCHMVSDLIEANTDLTVKRSPMLGGSQVCMGAIQSGEIDLYIDYTGTCYGDTLGYTPISDVEKVYQTVVRDFDEKYDLKILKQMAFNNTYTPVSYTHLPHRQGRGHGQNSGLEHRCGRLHYQTIQPVGDHRPGALAPAAVHPAGRRPHRARSADGGSHRLR